jgi:hypothetical protein
MALRIHPQVTGDNRTPAVTAVQLTAAFTIIDHMRSSTVNGKVIVVGGHCLLCRMPSVRRQEVHWLCWMQRLGP